MSRIAVIALVVANLFLLGLQVSQPKHKTDSAATQATAAASDIPTIHLLSEMLDDGGLLNDNRHCFTLGPLHTRAALNSVRGQLASVATSISERQSQAQVEKGYWVFIPPYASLLEANKALLSLQALGFNDSSVVYAGKLANAVSLGYYLRQKNALIRKRSLESKGYAPQMKVQRLDEPRYWLDYEQLPGSDLPTLDMQHYSADLMQRATPCPAAEVVTKTSPNATVTVSPPAPVAARRARPEAPGDGLSERQNSVDKGPGAKDPAVEQRAGEARTDDVGLAPAGGQW